VLIAGNMLRKILYQPFFIKLFNWEYWPFHIVYAPVYLYWIWLGAKARSFFFFNASNPSIKNGGFLLESKKAIYDLIPPQYYPPTLFFKAGSAPAGILQKISDNGLSFPVIGKPDIGGRGRGVKKLDTIDDVIDYAQNSQVDFLVQEFVPYENEAGIFYYRYPNEKNGHISGIVHKEFLTVEGDGSSTIEQLLKKEKRFILQLANLRKTKAEELKKIPGTGEKHLLVPYGNHARGAKFTDISYLVDETLTHSIDTACKKVNGFYFGRLDIKYNTWEELRHGKNFSIIELNGAGSEPTHIYDPKYSIFFAWKEIIRHLNILSRISRINNSQGKIPYMKLSSGLQMIKENSRYEKIISNDSKQRVLCFSLPPLL
jgi:hypothetical protein